MKTILAVSIAAAMSGVCLPAWADAPTGYATLGYTQSRSDDATLGEVQGRLGLRFGRYAGIEGEAGQGVDSDDVSIGGLQGNIKARPSVAAYGVGYLPLSDHADLFARVGYGTSRFRTTVGSVSSSDVDHNINYGVGGQYFFNAANGIRLDYTRKDLNSHRDDLDTGSVSYVRKF